MTCYTFPILGELAKALFDYSGLLALKDVDDDYPVDERTKKTIQTKIRRLAAESSQLEDNLDEVLSLFIHLLMEYFEDDKLITLAGNTITDFYLQYKDLVREDGACIPKKEVIKWLLCSKIPTRLSTSIHKYSLMYWMRQFSRQLPSAADWWLPRITSDEIVWPLTLAFDWFYEGFELPQTHIHNPLYGDKEKEDDRLKQDLQNSIRWRTGRGLPSWGGLVQNIKTVIEHHPFDSPVNKFSSEDSEVILAVFFVARFSTAVFKDIQKHFGNDFLRDVLRFTRKQDYRLKKLHAGFEDKILRVLSRNALGFHPSDLDVFYASATEQLWDEYRNEIMMGWQLNYDASIESLTRSNIRSLCSDIGSVTLAAYYAEYKHNVAQFYPPDFLRLFHDGLELKDKQCEVEELQLFKEDLVRCNLDDRLAWLSDWSFAVYHYRRDEHQTAYKYFKSAFNSAKYAAGRSQYLLVNQYIESCAKNDDLKGFKKGIGWANYLGVEVRWYRGFEYLESHEEKVRATFETMKRANYLIL
ncbi:hypothetical protein [Halodesulfovibrio sp.]|jgi:hypothetical protein|uniref:hypothetical protein n=1 Tax=Halodesulfovibrio sp. TaxID=1912772 RepID=UPI0025E417C6|nr:hypothetical protein [Halodesulfovibrio sp.]MCT4627719.1 hypothetical protein [Halodesulfovibrio sp.]